MYASLCCGVSVALLRLPASLESLCRRSLVPRSSPISVGSSHLSSSIFAIVLGSEDDPRISGSRDWDSEDDLIHMRRGQGLVGRTLV